MWCKAVVIVMLLLNINTVYNSGIDEEYNYLRYILKKLDNIVKDSSNGIGNGCRRHLNYYKKGLETHQMWAMQMLDAASKIPSGIAAGNIADLGSFDECLYINRQINASEYIKGRYCLGITNIDLNEIVSVNASLKLQLASCLPYTCSIDETAVIYSYFGLNITYSDNLCQTSLDQPALGVPEYCGIIFFAAISFIMIFSTIYDLYSQSSDLQTAKPLLVAFSIIKNGKRLITIGNDSKQMLCINGIRVISTMWIILVHRYSIQFTFPLRNNFFKQIWHTSAGNMFLLNGSIAVDTFFLLSGIVLSYVYLISVENKRPFKIFKFYFHRYLRLTPVLVAVIIFIVTLLRLFASGPLWPSTINSQLIEGCQIFWWKTLLYIQNYDSQPVMCIPHGWYLSADMQLFFISPLFLLSLSRWPKYTLLGTTFLIICNIIACFLLGWFLELNGTMQGNTDPEKQMDFVWYYYFPAYTRAAPWLIGIIVGYYLYLSKKSKYEMSKKIVIILWTLSIVILVAIVFGGHGIITSTYNRIANSIYIALVRPAWGLAVSGVIFACVNDFGGPVNWFLSLPIFEVLSRFTYTLYVVHYIVIYIITSQMKTTTIFRNLEAMYQFWGDFAFSLLAAVFLTLAFELPVIEMEKMMFHTTRTESKTTLRESKEHTADSIPTISVVT